MHEEGRTPFYGDFFLLLRSCSGGTLVQKCTQVAENTGVKIVLFGRSFISTRVHSSGEREREMKKMKIKQHET